MAAMGCLGQLLGTCGGLAIDGGDAVGQQKRQLPP